MNGIIFIGLQASGKSSFFLQEFYKTHIRLNLDMLKTRHRESILFNACLEGKQSCVIDNTNPTAQERVKYIDGFKKNHFEVHGYYFQSDIEACLLRNAKREGKEKIPEIGVKSTLKKLEKPSYAEGFDKLFYISIKDGKFIKEEYKDEV